ncbi:MAG: alpha-2-macroglobulin [Alphaproteobacteria bacterium PA4]|nr:MAG: alpha-2-macroglobulin [Alphaproteobacteria bacterium PA4]
MTRSGWIIGAALLALAAAGAVVNGAPTARVDRFSPRGAVQGPEQIAVHFTTPMVALGDPRLPAPVTGNCSAGATGRWADAQSYVVDLPAPLPGGQRCRYDLQPGLKDLRGAPVGGQQRFEFDTGGPAVRGTLPFGGTVEEDQVFLLALAAPPTAASVAANAACLIEGVGEAVPLDILPDKTRDSVIGGAAGDYSVRRFMEIAGWRKAEYGDDVTPPRATILAAKCRRTLPPGGKLGIIWGGGITTANGLTVAAPNRLAFTVRPAFTARFECSRVNAAAACSPLQAMRLAFAGEVPLADALAVRLIGPDGKAIAPMAPKNRVTTVGQVEWPALFVARSDYRIALPPQLRDDAGRPLANAARFPLAVATGEFPPLAKFGGTFGIIEAAEGGVLPVTLRGIERPLAAGGTTLAARDLPVASDAAVAAWLRRLDKAEERSFIEEPIAGSEDRRTIETTRSTPLIASGSGARGFRIERDRDPRRLEVVGIPLKTRGFHVVEIASPALGAALLGAGRTRYVATGALVTDLAVHWQWGKGRSLAWVTRLADATPVAGARIAISDSCTGKLYWQGRTDRSGRALIGDVLPPPNSYGSCDSDDSHPLMVSARTADDYSFTLSTWGNGIQGSDFSLPQGWGYEPKAVHTVFDRTLLRSGETINMKLISRLRSDAGFGPSPAITARTLTLRHLGSDTEFATPLTVAGSIATARWTVPRTAPLGDYQVLLNETGGARDAGAFKVEEYRLPTIRASVSGPRQRLVAPRQVPVDLALTYLSGGAVASAPVKLRTIVEPRTVKVSGYDNWSFNSENVVPGIVPLGSDGEEPDAGRAPLRAAMQPVALGPKGVARLLVDVAAVTGPSQLVAEMDYDDANGEVATTGSRIDLEPAALRVGIRTDGWLAKSDDLRLQLVVVDLEGRPVRNQRVRVKLFSRETYSYRKRLIGGFYAYDNSRETREIGSGCTGTSDAQGRLGCRLDAGISGEVLAVADVSDAAGRTARASTSVWLAGDDDWWFGGDNGDRMDVVPENARLAANGIARLQVRMPFRSATALVTVMRDGVIDSFVTTLSGKDPVVEVAMKPGYAPDVYVSVLAVRGRVAGWRLWLADLARRWNLPWLSREAASPTALVDLAKPSYRLGMARLTVGWERNRLGVTVASDRPSYPVRSAAGAKVTVIPPKGRALPRDAEIAFAAVDEALLQLQPNDSWDVLSAMMAERPLGVSFATAQTQVVGKRHYGRKAVAAGGGGGSGAALVRRDFNPVLVWRDRVRLDARGQALVPLRLNDSLSGFRLVAVATAGNDLFGTGMTTIRTTQDLQLLPGIPPFARDGDAYVATVLARNTTTAPMRVRLTGSAGTLRLPPLDLTIPAGGAQTAAWRVVAPAPGRIVWQIAAHAAGGQTDQVAVTQTITPAVPVETWQASFFQAGGSALPMASPAGALPGQGGVTVALSGSLGGDLPGVRAYMAAYPYDCIEQQLSRAVALGDRAGWDRAAAALPGYLDGNGLVRFFPADWIAGDDALTAYVLRLSAASGWPLPETARAPMIAGLTGFVMGRVVRSHADVLVVDKGSGRATRADLSGDEPVRLVTAVSALAAVGAARPTMLEPLNVTPDNWPTVTVIDWIGLLERLPVPGGAARMAQAEAVLRARLDVQGTTLRLNRSDAPFQLLASPDATAAQLLALAVRRPAWRSEAPRIARALMLAQRRGHWDTTPANALGTLAVRDFQRAFEAAPVTGATRVALGGQQRSFDWAGTPAPQILPWPVGTASLGVRHTGAGAPWVMVTARAAVPLTKAFASGFGLSRQVSPVTQAVPGQWSRGDVMRVRLTITPRAPAEWVVINDPVPAGATILGGTLGGRSQLLADAEGSGNGMPPSFVERRGDAVHAHYAALTRAPVIYDYTLRLGSVGSFRLPPTRVEALYAPDMMAMLPNAPLVVAPAP